MTAIVVSKRAPQRGRTLIEVMIAVAIGLMLTMGVLSIYLANRQTFRASSDVQRIQAAGQLALDRLAYQIRMAGYAPLASTGTGFRSGFTGAAITPCSGGFTNPNAVALACQNNPAQADAIAVSYQTDDPANPESGNFRDCLGAVVPLATGRVDNRFYVAVDNNGVSSLMCASGGVAAPLVPNVEDLQIRLRIGDPVAGRVDQVLPPESVPAANLGRVFAVELCVQVASEEMGLTAAPQAGPSAVDCQNRQNFNNPTDGRIRRTFTQVVTLRNRIL